jgi:hypothetical protein
MNTATRIGSYTLGIAVVFGGAFGVGHAVGPSEKEPAAAAHGKAHGEQDSMEKGKKMNNGHGGHGADKASDKAAAAAATDEVGGLRIAQNGYRLVVDSAPRTPDEKGPLSFRILGPNGKPVTEYTKQHDKLLHLIVARRDLSGFQHVHPELAKDGTWTIPLSWGAAGSYRVFADFDPAGKGAAMTLGADVHVGGEFTPKALPEIEPTAKVDGYTVTLDGGDITAGKASMLDLKVSKDGKPVKDLQPYLGAYGHLVALRQGDLGYIHVHPQGEPGDGKTDPGPEISFHTEAPSAGAYRLYLDFKHDGKVRTAEFTVNAKGAGAGADADTGGKVEAPAKGSEKDDGAEHKESGGGHAH